MRAKVFLVEDHPIYRAALIPYINSDPDLEVCGEAEDVAEAVKGIEGTQPNLILLDLQLRNSNGFELIRLARTRWPGVRVLVLTMYDEHQYAARALQAGASGYVTKLARPETVLKAIGMVLRGERFVSEKVRQALIEHEGAGSITDVLTDREMGIFLLVGHGRRPAEIAEALHMSEKTVHNHLTSIKRRLGLQSRQEVYQCAKEWVLRPNQL
ncbi:response regulator transcription factor [Rhodocaloribacter sp.]